MGVGQLGRDELPLRRAAISSTIARPAPGRQARTRAQVIVPRIEAVALHQDAHRAVGRLPP